VSAKRNAQDAKWGGATCQLPSLTTLLSVLPVLFFCLLFAVVPVPDAQAAASAYLADENGQTEITVDVEDTLGSISLTSSTSGTNSIPNAPDLGQEEKEPRITVGEKKHE